MFCFINDSQHSHEGHISLLWLYLLYCAYSHTAWNIQTHTGYFSVWLTLKLMLYMYLYEWWAVVTLCFSLLTNTAQPGRVYSILYPNAAYSHNPVCPGWPLILYYASITIHKKPATATARAVLAVLPSLLCANVRSSGADCFVCNKKPFSSYLSSGGRKRWNVMLIKVAHNQRCSPGARPVVLSSHSRTWKCQPAVLEENPCLGLCILEMTWSDTELLWRHWDDGSTLRSVGEMTLWDYCWGGVLLRVTIFPHFLNGTLILLYFHKPISSPLVDVKSCLKLSYV